MQRKQNLNCFEGHLRNRQDAVHEMVPLEQTEGTPFLEGSTVVYTELCPWATILPDVLLESLLFNSVKIRHLLSCIPSIICSDSVPISNVVKWDPQGSYWVDFDLLVRYFCPSCSVHRSFLLPHTQCDFDCSLLLLLTTAFALQPGPFSRGRRRDCLRLATLLLDFTHQSHQTDLIRLPFTNCL